MKILKAPLTFICFTLFLGIFYSFISKQTENKENAEVIVNKMLNAMMQVKTMKYKLKISERINNKIENRESSVKLQVSPRKIYLKVKNQELLWLQGENGGNAKVNPGSFPYVTLNLDPLSSLLRKDQHHTIHELGFSYIHSIIKNYAEIYTSSFSKHFILSGEEIVEGRPCYKIHLLTTNFIWEKYVVQKGENIVTIARKLHLSEYMILENNTSISDYNNVKEGQIINIPTSYAKFAILLVDKESYLPLSNRMFDEKGLFESYQYQELQINIIFTKEDFSKDNKEYNF